MFIYFVQVFSTINLGCCMMLLFKLRSLLELFVMVKFTWYNAHMSVEAVSNYLLVVLIYVTDYQLRRDC